MEHTPARLGLANTAAVVVEDSALPPNSSSDHSFSEGIKTYSSQSVAPMQTLDHPFRESTNSLEMGSKAAEGIEATAAAAETTNEVPQDLQLEDMAPDPDSDNENENKLSYDLLGNYLGGAFFRNSTLEQRKGKARRLAIQSSLHTQLVEDRLKELERHVEILLRIPTLKEDEENQEPLPHRLSIKHMTWPAFSAQVIIPESKIRRVNWLHSPEVDSVQKNVIEVLIEEPQLGRIPNWVSRNDSVPDIDPTMYDPYRIRLRSPLMLKLLERVTKQKVTIGPHRHQLVLLRPFKLLIAYADKFLEFLQVLEDKQDQISLSSGE